MNLFLGRKKEQIKNFLRRAAALAGTSRFRYGSVMLSVVIETGGDAEALARTLGSLVGGAVEGVVRDVIVCDRGACARTRDLCEQAGCRYLEHVPASAGIRQARAEWIMLLEPGARLLDGWTEAVLAHAGAAGGAARFTPARRSFMARLFARRRPLRDGLLIPKRQALALAEGDGSARAIAGAVRARRLAAGIVVPGEG